MIEVNKEIETLDVCQDTAWDIIRLGSLTEIVNKQPDNLEAKMEVERLEVKLKAHLSICAKCANAFKEEEK